MLYAFSYNFKKKIKKKIFAQLLLHEEKHSKAQSETLFKLPFT